MSNPASNSYYNYFRRRTIGRAASPPTWACYEQIPFDDDDYSDSCSDSCSEDDDDYPRSAALHDECLSGSSDSEDRDLPNPSDSDGHHHSRSTTNTTSAGVEEGHEMHDNNMDTDDDRADAEGAKEKESQHKDVKGKQKATDPVEQPEGKRRDRKKHNKPVYTLRPILTIHKSQGFVWNQDLFVPPYIKDRYVASTSPPNSRGFVPSSALTTNSGLPDYEVEVVEIRIKEGELDRIIP